ncbi:hypothetical protein E6H15_08050 [Candidatus Bathyarchaeota archaeon]|nr:MAG: hypothetical protein E6H15_08050 [Candidatus Bathyarchaeota archaeon]
MGGVEAVTMVRRPLWTPSEEHVKEANLTHFISLVNRKYSAGIQSYRELYRWSIEKVADFWSAMWDYAGIICSHSYDKVVDDFARFPGASWFPGARLNFAENLLRFRDERTAFAWRGGCGREGSVLVTELRATCPTWWKLRLRCWRRRALEQSGLVAGRSWARTLSLIVSARLGQRFCLRLTGISTKGASSTFCQVSRRLSMGSLRSRRSSWCRILEEM